MVQVTVDVELRSPSGVIACWQDPAIDPEMPTRWTVVCPCHDSDCATFETPRFAHIAKELHDMTCPLTTYEIRITAS